MCGIFCAINYNTNRLNEDRIFKSIQSMGHRGPDSIGVKVEKNLGLAHCRLAILDLSINGEQPMMDRLNKNCLIYNGEIYNFKEIKEELKKLNVVFYSNSDTEVVLKSISQWGAGALAKFNGMFSIIYYDAETSTLLVARDRYGTKPLYWSYRKNHLLFSSEIRGIKKYFESDKELRWEINSQSLEEYLIYQNIISEESIFENISLVPAGHFLEIDTRNFEGMKFQKYWEWNYFKSKNNVTSHESQLIVIRLIQESVERQLVGEVEIGTLLSGGVDSSLIAYAARGLKENLKAFTIGFDETEYPHEIMNVDELQQAIEFSKYQKIEHHSMTLNSKNFWESMPYIVSILEEPRMGQSYPNYFANNLASQKVKAVLAGTGGDEVFGGYPWRYLKNQEFQNWEHFLQAKFLASHKLVSNEELLKVYNFQAGSSLQDHFENFKKFFVAFADNEFNLDNKINASLNFDANTFLKGLLIIEDKLGMNFSIETRFPFLDNNLVDFASGIPIRNKIRFEDKTDQKVRLYFDKFLRNKLV